MNVTQMQPPPTPDQLLMAKIRANLRQYYSPAAGPFPESFLAALTANETGGDPTASRFESSVFAQLAMVATAKPKPKGKQE